MCGWGDKIYTVESEVRSEEKVLYERKRETGEYIPSSNIFRAMLVALALSALTFSRATLRFRAPYLICISYTSRYIQRDDILHTEYIERHYNTTSVRTTPPPWSQLPAALKAAASSAMPLFLYLPPPPRRRWLERNTKTTNVYGKMCPSSSSYIAAVRIL